MELSSPPPYRKMSVASWLFFYGWPPSVSDLYHFQSPKWHWLRTWHSIFGPPCPGYPSQTKMASFVCEPLLPCQLYIPRRFSNDFYLILNRSCHFGCTGLWLKLSLIATKKTKRLLQQAHSCPSLFRPTKSYIHLFNSNLQVNYQAFIIHI